MGFVLPVNPKMQVPGLIHLVMPPFFSFQESKSKEDLDGVTHKVYFDVEVSGKPIGMICLENWAHLF